MHEILLSHYQALLPRQAGKALCLGTAGSFGTETLRIIPGAGWKDLVITATFHPANGAPVRMLVPADGVLSVPPEAMAVSTDADAAAVIVFTGTSDGVQRISADLGYTILSHADIAGEASVPTENEWQQLSAAYNTKLDKQQGIEFAGKVLGIGEDGFVLPMDYTPASGNSGNNSGSSGEYAPADWSINDSAAPGYIHHRTHWAEDPVTITVLEETTVEATDDEPLAAFPGDTTLAEGSVYTLTLNGEAYVCTAYSVMGMVAIGNGAMVGLADTGEPFFAAYDPIEAALMIILPGGGSYTISLTGEYTEYHTLDKRFLPPLIGAVGAQTGAEVFNDVSTNQAIGMFSHAEGMGTAALGEFSHAEGAYTRAEGFGAHAEGYETAATGYYSHAEGLGTIASGDHQHAAGKYNQSSTNYAHILGGGYSTNERFNIHTIDWRGNAWFAGNLTLAGHPILSAPNGKNYYLKVNADGMLYTEAV